MIRLLTAFLVFAATLAAGDFPMFKGSPARLGRVADKLKMPIKLAWKVDAGGAFYSSPAIVSGTVYLGNSDRHVYAFDLQSGGQKWKARLPDRIYGSSPHFEQGLIYIGCVDGCVYALDAEGGSQRAQYCVKRFGYFGHGPDILGSPLVAQGRLYFGSDNHQIYSLQMPGGEKRWSFESGDRVHDSAAAIFENLLLMGSTDGHMYALDKDSGQPVWKSPGFEKLNTTAMVHDGRLYFGAGDGALRCLDARGGGLLWKFSTKMGIMSSPALNAEGTRLVFGGADGHVYCLGMDGSLKWKFKTGGPVLASPLITGNLAWIGSYDDKFYALDMSDGKEIFSHQSGGSIFSSAATASGKVVVGGRDGVLYCFEAAGK